MNIEKNKIILENFEMSKSYHPVSFLNFHENLNSNYGHILKVSMSMPNIPSQLSQYVDERLHPLVINTYERIDDHKEGEINVADSIRGDIYSFDPNGNFIQHIQSNQSELFESYKSRSSFGIGELLNHSETFTEALAQFEKQMARDVAIGDPRQKFVDRIKKIDGLIKKII